MFQVLFLSVSLFLLLSFFDLSLCEDACPPGSFIEDGECKLCRSGTYTKKKNRTFYLRCNAGTYYPFRGGKSSEICMRCSAGSYSEKRAAKQCKPCSPGTYSQAGACMICAPGKGLDTNGNYCKNCLSGFCRDGSFKYCTKCPCGTVANKGYGATYCLPCPKGTFLDTCLVSRIDLAYWSLGMGPLHKELVLHRRTVRGSVPSVHQARCLNPVPLHVNDAPLELVETLIWSKTAPSALMAWQVGPVPLRAITIQRAVLLTHLRT